MIRQDKVLRTFDPIIQDTIVSPRPRSDLHVAMKLINSSLCQTSHLETTGIKVHPFSKVASVTRKDPDSLFTVTLKPSKTDDATDGASSAATIEADQVL